MTVLVAYIEVFLTSMHTYRMHLWVRMTCFQMKYAWMHRVHSFMHGWMAYLHTAHGSGGWVRTVRRDRNQTDVAMTVARGRMEGLTLLFVINSDAKLIKQHSQQN